MDIAPVVTTFMKTDPVKIAATGVPIMRLYSPYTGLTPASTPDAIESGMEGIERVNPATISL
jgi:spore maturation protein SpmA